MAHKFVSYFGNWTPYCQARGKFLPDKIDPSLFKYFNFAFGQKNLNLKMFLSTGGWSFNCDDMPKVSQNKLFLPSLYLQITQPNGSRAK